MDEQEQGGSRIKSGMTSGRKPPRWVIPFLRALERSGEVEAAAADAGIDKSTAYYRRKAYPDFAEAWEEALRLHAGKAQAQVQERVGFWDRVKKGGLSAVGALAPPPSAFAEAAADGPPPRASRREDLLATTALGGQLKRVGAGRWNQAAEARFFDELAATANVKRACAAAGVSTNAVYARRMKRPDFRAKWDAVLETARSAIEMHLVEAARNTFDPDDIDTGNVHPKVSVAEATRILQLHGGKAKASPEAVAEPDAAEIEAIRERVIKKLQRLREREMRRMADEGWSHDESFDEMVPPGWIKGPDYQPRAPDMEEGRDEAGY